MKKNIIRRIITYTICLLFCMFGHFIGGLNPITIIVCGMFLGMFVEFGIILNNDF